MRIYLLIALWIIVGGILGTLYTLSIRREIDHSLRGDRSLMQRNPIFSILRIIVCSVVLVFAFYQDFWYGLVCFFAFLIAKYVSLVIMLKPQKEGE